MKSIAQTISCLLLASLIAGGCSKPVTPKVPMADPPAYGSKPELSNIKAFLAGRWGMEMYMDKNAAKLPGMDAIYKDFEENAKDQKIEDVFNFKDDGTFRLSGATWGHRVEGTWQEQGAALMLTYVKLDGKPYQERLSEITKTSESGKQADLYEAEGADRLDGKLKALAQLRISDDKKFFIFQGPGLMGGMEDNGFRIVRLAPAEK